MRLLLDTLLLYAIVAVVSGCMDISSSPNEPGEISGVVYDLTSGYAIKSARVAIVDSVIITDGTGIYRFESVPPGKHLVSVSRSGYLSDTVAVTVIPNETTTLRLGLMSESSFGTISGRVKGGATGHGVSNAIVSIGGRTTVSSSLGYYTLSGIPLGTYMISVSAVGYRDESYSMNVFSAITYFADFKLRSEPATGNINGWVIDASNGSGIYYAIVTIGGRFTVTDLSGHFFMSHLSPGRYACSTTTYRHNTYIRMVDVEAGTTTDCTLPLRNR
jgi:large repetitive protein